MFAEENGLIEVLGGTLTFVEMSKLQALRWNYIPDMGSGKEI